MSDGLEALLVLKVSGLGSGVEEGVGGVNPCKPFHTYASMKHLKVILHPIKEEAMRGFM